MKIEKVLAMKIGLFFRYCDDIASQKSDIFSSCLNKSFMDVLFTKLRNSYSISSGISSQQTVIAA